MNTIRKRWWPAHQAIAWVYTRDEDFVQTLGEEPSRLLFIEFQLQMNPELISKKSPLLPSKISEAERLLEVAINDGNIQTDGVYFERRSSSNGDASTEYHSERDEISPSKLRGMRYHQDDKYCLCLISKDDLIARGSNWANLRGYRDIWHNVSDLRRCFKPVRIEKLEPVVRMQVKDADIERYVQRYFDDNPNNVSRWQAYLAIREELPGASRARIFAIYDRCRTQRGILANGVGKPRKLAAK
jgi:hypothetical protein